MRIMSRALPAAAAAAAMVLIPTAGLADAAPPWQPGDTAGTPSGAVKDVFIEHEDLSMDLSHVAGSNPQGADVVASYALRNDGPARGIDLVFVTASYGVTSYEVTLDGRRVSASPGPLGSVPRSWQPPAGTPSLGPGGPDLRYDVGPPAAILFHIALAQGSHDLLTRYRASPAKYSGDATVGEPVYWQLAFVLSPARQWEGFGDLDVKVTVPSGWPAATRPDLTRQGNTLTGHFVGIPSDAIAITTQMPLPAEWTRTGWIAGFSLLVPLSLLAGFLLVRTIGWRGAVVGLLAFVPALAALFAIGVVIATNSRSFAVPSAQASWWGGRGVIFLQAWELIVGMCAGLLAGAVAVLVGSGIALVVGNARRAR